MLTWVQVDTFLEGVHPSNALELVAAHDLVIDASDNAPTRYLLSDACVIAKKPLVSGAAIGTDGQLTVYAHGQHGNSHSGICFLTANHFTTAVNKQDRG